MAKNIVFILVLIFSVFAKFSSADYCHIKSCNGKAHTMCTYSKPGPSSKCGKVLKSGLSKNEKQKIINSHNNLRQKVARGQETRGNPGPQPAAKSMPNLSWDNELAKVAQRWADQCSWGHDSCRNVERYPVGQNIAYIGTTANVKDLRVETMVNNWYNEVKDYSKNDVAHFSNKGRDGRMVGHYTQMVWAKTKKIGCGGIKYNDGKFKKFYLVCNYGPTGNWMGKPLYKAK